jgi:lysyl endopeptidase
LGNVFASNEFLTDPGSCPMNRLHSYFGLLCLFLCVDVAQAAIEAPPTAQRFALRPLSTVPVNQLKALDRIKLLAEDVVSEERGEVPRFAVEIPVTVSPRTDGVWEQADTGQLVWRYRVTANEARSLSFAFTQFYLPEGASVMVYAPNFSEKIGPFTPLNNNVARQLWTPPMFTNDLVIELTVAATAKERVVLEMTQINQGYKAIGENLSPDKSGACNMDVACLLPDDPWRKEMRSVAALVRSGTRFCTGSLLNNVNGDRKLLFMTANHCGVTAANVAATTAIWNFQSPTCRVPGSAASGGAGGGSQTQFTLGGTLRATRAGSDFTLVELTGSADPAWNLYWSGWDRTAGDNACSAANKCAAIHHPNVDEKRITFSRDPTTTTSYNVATVPGDGTHVHSFWDPTPLFPPDPTQVIPAAVTEGGSSGSPLYNANHLFVGQLHGGPSACGSTGAQLSDYYGRFNLSWNAGGTAATQAKDWLDPSNTDPMTLAGVDSCTQPNAPITITATPTAANQMTINWGGPTSGLKFRVFRTLGTCSSSGYTLLADNVTGSSYVDSTVSGTTTYAYKVTAVTTSDSCESAFSVCGSGTATGACTLAPNFAGIASANSAGLASCTNNLSWTAASAQCTGPMTYNIYRGNAAGFAPALANRIGTGVAASSFVDTGPLTFATPYFYKVRAVDTSNGLEEANVIERSAAPGGAVTASLSDTFEGAGGYDGAGWTHQAIAGANDWTLSTTQFHTPTHSWSSVSLPSVSNRVTVSPAFVPAAGMTLSFWHTYAFEGSATSCFDAGTLEVSTDGGTAWSVMPDAAFISGGFTGTVSTGYMNPLGGKRAWCVGALGPMSEVKVNLDSFAGQSIKLRWHAGDDSSVVVTGWFIDSVSISSTASCSSVDPGTVFANGFE